MIPAATSGFRKQAYQSRRLQPQGPTISHTVVLSRQAATAKTHKSRGSMPWGSGRAAPVSYEERSGTTPDASAIRRNPLRGEIANELDGITIYVNVGFTTYERYAEKLQA